MRRVACVALAACGRLVFVDLPPARVEVPATVAACIDPMQPNPAPERASTAPASSSSI
jgi:hypothetical protein